MPIADRDRTVARMIKHEDTKMNADAPASGHTSCLLKFPYEVNYIQPRGRKPKNLRVPGVAEVNFRTIGDADAPTAFVVTAGDSPLTLNSFEVREFEGECWWPLSYDEKLVSIRQFVEALASGDERYLTLVLGSRINQDFGWGHWTWRRFEDLEIREILANNIDERLRLVRRGVEDFLCCGDRVYVRGSDPVYCCAVWKSEHADARVEIDVADPRRRPVSVQYPRARPLGNGSDYFSSCAPAGMVFRSDEREKLSDFLETLGLDRKFTASIEIVLPQNIRSNPVQIAVAAQVDALSRQIELDHLPPESDEFKSLSMVHARLGSIAAQRMIEIDEGASALAGLLMSRKRIALIGAHDAKLSRQLADLQKPLKDLIERVREHCGSPRGSTSFLHRRDERALRSLGFRDLA